MRTLKPSPVTRRSLIQGLGLGAASLALPRARPARSASPIPTRFVVLVGGGMVYDVPWPTAPGGGPPAETGWVMGEAHAPLAPWKDKCLYVDGVSMISQQVDPNPDKGNAHQQGAMHALAAANTSKQGLPGGPTIDQAIAQALNKPTPVTKLPSVQMLIGSWYGDIGDAYFSSAANTMMPVAWSPQDVWKRVFGDFVAPAGGPSSLAEMQREQQLAVLGLAKDDFGRLATRLGAADRQRLEVHQALLADLERRMKLATPRTCAAPPASGPFGSCMFTCWAQKYVENFKTSREHNLRIAAAALACDLTRVVSIELQVPDEMTSFKAGMDGNGDLHGLIHNVCDAQKPASKDPVMRKPCIEANVVEAETVAMLAEQLAQIPEADGTSLLDHTIILFAGHIGYGSHDLNRLPWVVVGGGAAGLRLGRYVKLPRDPRHRDGRPHNDYLLTLARAAGANLPSFGNPTLSSGPIAEMMR